MSTERDPDPDPDPEARQRALEAARDRFGDRSSTLLPEFQIQVGSQHERVHLDGLITRIDEDAIEERERRGIDGALTGDRLGVYEWFQRASARDPSELLATTSEPFSDLRIILDLFDDGYLTVADADGKMQAVDVPRAIEVVALEVIRDADELRSCNLHRSREVTDEQWLLVVDKGSDEVAPYSQHLERSGIGLASVSTDGHLNVIVEPDATGAGDERRAREIVGQIKALEKSRSVRAATGDSE